MSTTELPFRLQRRVVDLDVRGKAWLGGVWEFYPGDHERSELDRLAAEPITVPGLWEAQGHLDLDGVAWYRLPFALGADLFAPHYFWTLRFGAVMDIAQVYVNGTLLGRHEHPFTPFELPLTAVVHSGDNVIDVRVTDPAVDDPEHIRLAHGKQGWANHVFPSRPSLYMTYGGIWQDVQLRRHGSAITGNIFVNSDPDDLTVAVDVCNVSADPVAAELGVRTIGLAHQEWLALDPFEQRTVEVGFGATRAPRWRPGSPILHEALIDLVVNGSLSDGRQIRYGLRRIEVDGSRLRLDGAPYRMKSVLVQGFRAAELYAEGSRDDIRSEVRAAQEMGFNTLRLHIKAFDPAYLDVCDEMGMLLHCDLPIAEPIAHDELGDGTVLSGRAVEAVREQVHRDRNHPSIILWSAMNELGYDRAGTHESPEYEQFARTLYATVREADPTRPVIENDWVEPDPDRVFCSPILTAHWYGRLHADYLDALDHESQRWSGTGRPLYVTEFGDWGLPAMPALAQAPFWDTRAVYTAGLAESRWPGTISRFLVETQRYQGLSDRLQAEVFRRHDHIGGYCLTELTDVPHELNGLLDLHRQPKPIAVAEMTRANQEVLPMLHLDSLVLVAGQQMRAPLHVANDGPPLRRVEIAARLGSSRDVWRGELAGFSASQIARFTLRAPDVPGSHDLLLTLHCDGRAVAENRYPMHVVASPAAPFAVRLLGAGSAAEALTRVGARPGPTGPTVVAEDGLDEDAGAEIGSRLAAGQTVVVLAQRVQMSPHYPIPVQLVEMETAWGSTEFHFTTDSGALPSLPRRTVLVAEEATMQALCVVTRVEAAAFPDEPVVIAYKPVPGAITGTVVGAHRVGAGRLLLCQYRLARRAAMGDPAAGALLADVVRWAADPRPALARRDVAGSDGESVSYYSLGRAGDHE